MIVEIGIIIFVVLLEAGHFFYNLWRKSQWQRSGKIKEADHARGLAVQIYTRKAYDKRTTSLPVTNTYNSRTRPRPRA